MKYECTTWKGCKPAVRFVQIKNSFACGVPKEIHIQMPLGAFDCRVPMSQRIFVFKGVRF